MALAPRSRKILRWSLGIALALVLAWGANWTFSPFQDRESEGYRLWLAERERDAERQMRMNHRVLNEPVPFNRIELVHVGPGANYYSWWGHLLLRLVGSGATPDDDLTVS